MDYTIVLYKNGMPVRTEHLMNGDAFVFDTPDTIIQGKVLVLRWKIRSLERAVKTCHRIISERDREIGDLRVTLEAKEVLLRGMLST